MGLADLGKRREHEAEQPLSGQAGNVLDKGDGVERISTLRAQTHVRNHALGRGRSAGAEGEKELG